MFPREGGFNREIALKLLPNPTKVIFLDSSKVKPTIATSGAVPRLMEYQIRFCKRQLHLNRSPADLSSFPESSLISPPRNNRRSISNESGRFLGIVFVHLIGSSVLLSKNTIKGAFPRRHFFGGSRTRCVKKLTKTSRAFLRALAFFTSSKKKIDLLVRFVRPFIHHSVLCKFSTKKELCGAYPGTLMHSNVSNVFNILMQYRVRFCKRPLALNRSLTQREN